MSDCVMTTYDSGRFRRSDVSAKRRRQVHAVRRYQLGHRVCREESAGSLHKDLRLQGLDQPDPPVLTDTRAVFRLRLTHGCII